MFSLSHAASWGRAGPEGYIIIGREGCLVVSLELLLDSFLADL